MWACIFGVKWYTVGIHNAIARSGLEKNSSEDVSLWKEKAPLLQWIFWLKKSGLITFLKILLSCRWIYWTFASAKDETPWWRVVSEWHFNPKEKKTSSRRWDKDISIDSPLDPHPPPPPHLLSPCPCDTYYSLSPHLDAFLWCLYVFSQPRSSQWRRISVAFGPTQKLEGTRASSRNRGSNINGVWLWPY